VDQLVEAAALGAGEVREHRAGLAA